MEASTQNRLMVSFRWGSMVQLLTTTKTKCGMDSKKGHRSAKVDPVADREMPVQDIFYMMPRIERCSTKGLFWIDF
jgi:hypothetical protein